MSRVCMQILVLAVFFSLTMLVAGAGAIVNCHSLHTWYVTLHKPDWTPSGPMIGAIWTFLYGCMALAAFIVWRDLGMRKAAAPLALWAIQLGLNFLWSLIFFGLRWPMLAFAELVVLWCAILATLLVFFRISAFAGFLFIPYLAWVSFAGALNFFLWRMNP